MTGQEVPFLTPRENCNQGTSPPTLYRAHSALSAANCAKGRVANALWAYILFAGVVSNN